MVSKEEYDITLDGWNDLKKQLEEIKNDKVKLEEERGKLKEEKAELLKASNEDKEKLVKLEQQLVVKQEQLNNLEQGKTEADNQKQELTKKVTDLENEIASLRKKIKDLQNQIAQFPGLVADYEEQISRLNKEVFNLKNEKNEELENVKKQLTDFLIGAGENSEQASQNQKSNHLKEIDVEEIKKVIVEYLKSIRKELKELQDLDQIVEGQEKEIYQKRQEELKVNIERILELENSLNSQLTAQIEQEV